MLATQSEPICAYFWHQSITLFIMGKINAYIQTEYRGIKHLTESFIPVGSHLSHQDNRGYGMSQH